MQQYAFTDFFKTNFDFNQALSSQRRDIEALSEANQVVVEGAQEGFRASAEALRSNVETALKTSKEVMNGGSPEASLAKQAELAKSFYEGTLATLRELTEMGTKCSFEVFEVLNRRASEKFAELSKPAAHTNKKK